MEPKTKEKLTKIAIATLRNLKVGRYKVTLEMLVRKTQLPVAKNARILAAQDMRRRVQNARLWQETSEEMALEWMADFMTDIQRKQNADASKVELSAARERQLSLFPGFESLPTRIRKGSNYLKFPDAPVPDFLAYATKYEKRSQRDHRTADELRRLAKAVEPYAEMDLTVAAAFERAKTETASKVVTMPSVG